ncbi:HD domain-containing protein [Candidatus Dojkabacteria bacterium]|nr:HD domain-containing protein [Candidatus Dojkabacteria bacterium]
MNYYEIIHKLCESGYPAYLVGGCVRDFFDGQEPHDFDIVTKATPEQIAKVFQGFNVNLVGKTFGVTLVEGFEVATYRIDQYPNKNGAKNCVPIFADTIQDDLSRRDLTVNAIALCPISGDYIDEFDGINDLKNRTVRFVGNADERISEDACRILRACRFLAKLEGCFDIDTLQSLQRNAHKVKEIAPERIKDEILKAMTVKHPSIFFAALYIIGALDYVFPGLSKAVDHSHGKHHKENIFEHLMLVGDHISPRFPLVRLAGYLHDAGKVSAYNFHGNGTFINHEVVGADIVYAWLKRLKFSNEDRDTIVNLVRTHMIGSYQEQSPKAIRKFLVTLHNLGVNKNDWLRIRIADRRGNINKGFFNISDIKRRRKLFDFKEEPVVDVNCLALRGGDLIKIFKLTPGPLVGQLQRHLFNFIVDIGFEHNTQEVLIKEAENFLSN